MSWQLGSFAILGLALAAGFGWYERSKPDARIVALVATLAAFGALGRIAFAAVPNVKPTSDIVLISGYALGGGPGFVVGALAGLTSNFFFGQGPWTPWQMAAWGVTGLLGAGLAIVTRHRIRRVPLAVVCFVAGFAFTAAQDFGDWVTYSDHSASQLAIYVGKGIGFDFVHATGCLLFALAFGPALSRAIERFTRRLQVTWRPASGTAVTLVIVLTLGSTAWLAGQPGGIPGGGGGGIGIGDALAATPTPLQYLLGAQNDDGGFGAAAGQASSQLYAGWAALGLAADGDNPQAVIHDGHNLLSYVEAGSLSDTGSLERTILVARAAGVSAAAFDGHDLVVALQGRIERDGSVSQQVNLTSFAVLALRAAGVTPPARTLAWLARQQDSDGGFNFATAGGASDVDDTGAALEALAGDAGARATIGRAIRFLERNQNPDGGFPSQPGATSNAQSTAFAVQGLIATGVALPSLRHGSPDSYLSSLIAANGSIDYARGSAQTPVWVTGEALMALAGKPLPLGPVPLPATPASHPKQHHHAAAHGAKVRHSPTRRRRAAGRPKAPAGSRGPVPSMADLAADAATVAALALAPIDG